MEIHQLDHWEITLLQIGLGTALLAILRSIVTRFRAFKVTPPTFSLLTTATKDKIVKLPPTRSIRTRLQQTQKNCMVLYGSQTGTAEKYALRFGKEANSRYGLESMVADLDDFDYGDLESLGSDSLIVLILATYGEGEPTDNAITFQQYLDRAMSRSVQIPVLSTLQYAAFGLGSSAYSEYNAMVKRTDLYLSASGAARIGQLGLGDDGLGTLEEDYTTWQDNTLTAIATRFGLSRLQYQFKPDFGVNENNSATQLGIYLGEPNVKHLRNRITGPFTSNNPYPAPIVQAKGLFPGSQRECIHMEFDISGSTVNYETGDHLAVWPTNAEAEVDRFLVVFGYSSKSDTEIEVTTTSPEIKIPIPTPTTYRAAVRHYLDIGAPVTRHMLSTMATLVSNQSKRHSLLDWSKEKERFEREVSLPRLNLAQTLALIAPSEPFAEIPFSFLLENVAKLQPRHYSISSSSLVNCQRISITAVVDSFQLPGSKMVFNGCSTSYISALKNRFSTELKIEELNPTHAFREPHGMDDGQTALIHVRRSKFRLPRQVSVPIIMIGPGTGVAPFRAFVQERAALAQSGKQVGRTVLFYGCRSRAEDFLYEEEWDLQARQFGTGVFSMHTAFSREPGTKKTYVQDLIRRNGVELRDLLLHRGAVVYVCGDAGRMAKDVFKTFAKILADDGGAEFLRQLKREKRWNEDVW